MARACAANLPASPMGLQFPPCSQPFAVPHLGNVGMPHRFPSKRTIVCASSTSLPDGRGSGFPVSKQNTQISHGNGCCLYVSIIGRSTRVCCKASSPNPIHTILPQGSCSLNQPLAVGTCSDRRTDRRTDITQERKPSPTVALLALAFFFFLLLGPVCLFLVSIVPSCCLVLHWCSWHALRKNAHFKLLSLSVSRNTEERDLINNR